MATQILRVHEEVYQQIKDLSQEAGIPMSHLIAKAVEEYRKNVFFAELDEAFARLKNDPQAWEDEQKERDLTANTLSDDLDE